MSYRDSIGGGKNFWDLVDEVAEENENKEHLRVSTSRQNGMTHREIAEIFGMTLQRVEQIEKKALSKLKKKLSKYEFEYFFER